MWETVLSLAEMDGQSPPALAEALLLALRHAVRGARGGSVLSGLKRLHRHWPSDGVLAIISAPVEISLLGRARRPDKVVAVHDKVIDTLVPNWHEFFQARIRLCAVTISALADSVPAMSGEERSRYSAVVERLLADGHRTYGIQVEEGIFWGPEGRAWVKRLDAETMRFRWLAGHDAASLEDLVRTWRETVTLFEDYGHVHELAWCRAHLAAILRASGDQAGARELSDLARVAARDLGAEPLLDELRTLGSTPARPESGAPAALTPREAEILALVANGRTNGEIGKQLFISAKTVSVHVSNILGKLGAASRTEAAAIGHRRGLLG
jgi:DNA-binding CsgD family transcriptional regulator